MRVYRESDLKKMKVADLKPVPKPEKEKPKEDFPSAQDRFFTALTEKLNLTQGDTKEKYDRILDLVEKFTYKESPNIKVEPSPAPNVNVKVDNAKEWVFEIERDGRGLITQIRAKRV